jgi:UDP-N-acetylmuramoyl-tripeptide--D-alanyl-D-alanine ligase
MYQLNHYKDKVQVNWIIKNIKQIFIKDITLFVSIILFFCGTWGKVAGAILFVFAAYINRLKNIKKPLVYTNRVKRLITTSMLLAAMLITILKCTGVQVELILSAMAILNILVPVIVLFANILNKPIDNTINKYYINDAKKIIKSMPNLIVIGVTGSYGKTSVKNFLNKFLSAKYNVLITPENYNTTLGVAKTIRENLKATHDIFVCEMGATEREDIKKICEIVNPKYGIITSIGSQHLESFGTIENIIKTKYELADSISDDGMVFLNYDNEYIYNTKVNKNVVSYGINDSTKNLYNAYEITSSSKGLTFKTQDENKNEKIFQTKLIGNHNVENIVGAIAVANKLGVTIDILVKKVRQLDSVQHRLELIQGHNSLIIDDAYNSNPVGSKYALDALNTFNGVKILITPGMIELGSKQYEYNYEFGVYATKVCDYIILVGKAQTKPIQEGIVSTSYDKNKLVIVDTIQQAMKEVENIETNNVQKIILLEKDLPDNY